MKSTLHRLLRDLRERLLHLGGVAVREQAVRRDVLVRFREQARGLEPAARAGDARDGVGDDARLDEVEREERRAREADRGRVATGRRDVRVRGDLVAVELDEPVREPVDHLGRVVRLAVPAGVDVGRQPEVGAEIDRVADVVEQAGQQRLARAVRQETEQEVETGEVGGDERRVPEVLVGAEQPRVQLADGRAHVAVGRDVHDLDLGVAGQEAQQLGSGIAGPADDSRSIRHGAYNTAR